MKKLLATVVCAVMVVSSFSVVGNSSKLGFLGADIVSAASETTSSGSSSGSSSGGSSYVSSVQATKFTRVLKYGSKGGDVKLLQTVLNVDGYGLKVDGSFGPATLKAVKDFQGKNGLAVDGSVGPLTQAKLAPKIPAAPAPTFTRVLKYGLKGDDVKLLQTKLNENGAKLTVDGSFGPATLAAVKEYQKAKGLKVDGLVGPATQAKLGPATTTPPTTTPPTTTPPVDTVSAASITDNPVAFEKALATADKGGKWIICATKDITIDHAVVMDGNYGKKDSTTGVTTIQRKIGLYTQVPRLDANGNPVLDATTGKAIKDVGLRFTLTVPKLTILSMNTSIQHGTVKGDIYVSAQNFKLVDTTVTGNVFFTNYGAAKTFTMDTDSKISGMKTTLTLPETVDAYASASRVLTNDAFEKAMTAGEDGKWIICTLDNLKFTKDIVLDGDKYNTKTPPALARKVAIYAHDLKSSAITTGRFILEAPKFTIKSNSANITKGMFKGDLYISGKDFKLVDAIVDGNVYFMNEDAKNTFTKDATSIVTKKIEMAPAQ